MKKINVQVGDTIERIGCNALARADGSERLENGALGKVVEVYPPRRGLGAITDLDGEEIDDPDRDGWAAVQYEGWTPRIRIVPDDAGKRWACVKIPRANT